jgi:hypothetical protein
MLQRNSVPQNFKAQCVFPSPKWKIVSSRELRRGESGEEMHSCLPTLVKSAFVETKNW